MLAGARERLIYLINKGEIISGTVVSMNTKDVVLNIGFKSDGMIPLSEFRDTNANPKVGDEVEVFIEEKEEIH